MSSSKNIMLADLNKADNDFTLKIKIIKVWKNSFKAKGKVVNTIEFVAFDEHGSTIPGQVYENWWKKFQEYMVDGIVLVIRNPNIDGNYNKSKYSANLNKLNLTFNTKVTISQDWNGRNHCFHFTSFADIEKRGIDEYSIIDIIGLVVHYSDLDTVFVKKDQSMKKKMNLQIQDKDGIILKLILWAEYAQQMSDFLKKNPLLPSLVIVLQFALYKTYDGDVNMSNTLNATSILHINEDLEEIETFKKSFEANSEGQNSSTVTLSAPSRDPAVMLQFLTENKFMTCADFETLDTVGKYVIYGTIKYILIDMPWQYKVCPVCNSSLSLGQLIRDDTYICNKKTDCKDKEVQAAQKYKVYIKVQDNTGIVTLNLFDNVVTKMVNKSAANMIENLKYDSEEMPLFPSELQELVGRTCGWLIEFTNYNKENPTCKVFTVLKFTEDEFILEELKKKLHIVPDVSGSSSTLLDSNVSENTGKQIEAGYGDNCTPSTENVKEMASASVDLKRNLSEVYDVDELASHSATKPAQVAKEPKLEK